MISKNKLQKNLINSFIFSILFLIITDSLPETSLVHRHLKQTIDPVLDKLGIWQGTWQLFAPNVDKINQRFVAEITFSDQSKGIWYSPNWSQLSIKDRFLKFRQMEYYDSIYYTKNKRAWEAFAKHLSRTIVAAHDPNIKPIKIILIREWADIPAPNNKKLPSLNTKYKFNNRRKFYTWSSSL
ncbi:MAG: hypothetical protein QNJ64_17360 [Crocosphaera sp.]|nr:hypothetical protein [Crocosphaera sp.]